MPSLQRARRPWRRPPPSPAALTGRCVGGGCGRTCSAAAPAPWLHATTWWLVYRVAVRLGSMPAQLETHQVGRQLTYISVQSDGDQHATVTHTTACSRRRSAPVCCCGSCLYALARRWGSATPQQPASAVAAACGSAAAEQPPICQPPAHSCQCAVLPACLFCPGPQVHKFGGTCVAAAERIDAICKYLVEGGAAASAQSAERQVRAGGATGPQRVACRCWRQPRGEAGSVLATRRCGLPAPAASKRCTCCAAWSASNPPSLPARAPRRPPSLRLYPPLPWPAAPPRARRWWW